MDEPADILPSLTRTFAHLTPQAGASTGRLEELLVQSRLSDVASGGAGTELSVEGANWPGRPERAHEALRRLTEEATRLDPEAPPRYRVFRREVSVPAAGVPLAAPSWGRGAAIAESLGPFVDAHGRQYWFDFYPIVKLVPVYLAGDTQPALLFHVHQLRLRLTDAFVPSDFRRLLKGQQYTLRAGSVWIRADLLAPAAPLGHYVGLKIKRGQLRFTPVPDTSSAELTIPAGGRVDARLQLDAPPAAPATGEAGIDAARAEVDLPGSFWFTLDNTGARATRLTDATWTLYGDAVGFTFNGEKPATYQPDLESVLIPMDTSKEQVDVTVVESPFAEPRGSAAIIRSGWCLPTAEIDTAGPPAAAGIGGLTVRAEAGLTIGWRGLRNGPIHLRSPWLRLLPGSVSVLDPEASNLYAQQTLRLWQDADSRFRSELRLRYTDAFRLQYVVNASGTELLSTQADAEACVDRPVDARGTPLSVRTLKSDLVLSYTDATQTASLYDDNMLVDAKDPDAVWPESPDAVSLAIRNALLTTTPVNTMVLVARLADAESAAEGSLLLGMGLRGLLPILPDPYAANVGVLRRSAESGRVMLLLVAVTGWEKAALEGDPDKVEVRFALAPTALASAVGEGTVLADPRPSGGGAFTGPSADVAGERASILGVDGSDESEAVWDRDFDGFGVEQFSLLDVSSNADQMGVSFAWFDDKGAEERGPIFYRIYGVETGDDQPSAFPLQIHDLDLSAQSRFVRAFTLPQISWEPLVNLPGPQPPIPGDPPIGFNLYPNDGGPTRLVTNSVELVPIAPLPVTEFLVKDFAESPSGFTGGLFTLPFGLRAFAEFSRTNAFEPSLGGAALNFNRPEYEEGGLVGGLQVRADAPRHPTQSPIFRGRTFQLSNVLNAAGLPTGAGTLGHSVGFIFNEEFFFDGAAGFKDRGVPLTRIDFSGYGASIFSHWQNPDAAIAETSQSVFDVFVGRTAHEVVQVRSLLYPWGVRVVRTITIFRTSSAHVFRFDTGWQAESDGRYDFRYKVYNQNLDSISRPNPYEFHPGIVRRITRVRNIVETASVPKFEDPWNKSIGDPYVDDNGILRFVDASTPPDQRNPTVTLQPVFFDADVVIDGVKSGGTDGRVPSRQMLGYVQLAPRGEPLPPKLFANLLENQFGSLGGPVDCVVELAGSGQLMRLSRVDVNVSQDPGGQPIFVSAGRGSVVLPKDGSWSVVVHNQGTGEVTPLDTGASVPVVRRGKLNADAQGTNAGPADLLRIAAPMDLVKAADTATRNFGFLQSTGTQKALFRLPSFQEGVGELLGAPPDFADAYRILNSVGIFPNVQDAVPLALGDFKTEILEEGYRLVNDANEVFEQFLPEGPLFLINEDILKLYVEYAKKGKAGTQAGRVEYGFDSAATELGKRWLSKVNDISMVVDLGPLQRLMIIKGRFDAEKGADPAFAAPELEFSDALQPVIDILQILQELQGGDYKAAFAKGLEIAMSNSADSWNYAFHARKDIPVVRFPPGELYDNPTNAFKLEAHMAVGVYFNESLTLTTDPKQLVPSAGAFLEFGGSLSVMCVSLAAATVYATGSVDLRTAADIKTGPALDMKFGFGAEVVAGLPVVGNVSLLFMVGVEMHLDQTQITVSGFLLFRGRAEILGGIVTVTITIEAKGSVKRMIGPPDRTDMIAQVTFGLDISIFLVVNISFSKSWEENRQIA